MSAPPAEIVFLIASAFRLTERGAGSAFGRCCGGSVAAAAEDKIVGTLVPSATPFNVGFFFLNPSFACACACACSAAISSCFAALTELKYASAKSAEDVTISH